MMTREKKIEKISRLVPQALDGDFKALAEEIVDALDEEEPERFFDDEVVCDVTTGSFRRHVNAAKAIKMPTHILAATIGARIEDAKWWSIDADGWMRWWASEPAWFEETSTRKIHGWVSGNFLAGIPTTIRQEPDKGKL
jgi:hypothetical protein